MVAFSDLYSVRTLEQIKEIVLTTATSAGLAVRNWIPGDPSERWIEISARLLDTLSSNVIAQVVRAFFFELNTDPGDPGDLSADQTPRPGFLSAFGSGWWGTIRGERTYATGFVTVTNSGSTTATFAPYDLTFQRSTAGPSGEKPTYRNTEDAGIYVGLGGTLVLAPGASETIPIVCEQLGSAGSAAPGQISIVVTQSFGTLTCANANPVIGSDREARELYIARCRQASAAASPNGPRDAYRYASTTGADGKPLQLYDGSGETTVNRVYVSADSGTAEVTIYLANPSGPATAVEVSSANGNIWGIEIPDVDGTIHNPNPIGVVPDTASLGPTLADAVTGAPGPAPAVAKNIGPLKGTARIKAVAGLSSTALITAVHTAIEHDLSAFFADPDLAPIGGVDQLLGAGVIHTSDLQDTVKEAYPQPVNGLETKALLYGVTLTSPATATTAIALGEVPVYVGPPAVTGAANNGSGLIRLTVSSSAVLTTGTVIQVYGVSVTGGSGDWLSGTWTVTNIDPTHVDLQGSAFPLGGGFVAASLSLIVVIVVS